MRATATALVAVTQNDSSCDSLPVFSSLLCTRRTKSGRERPSWHRGAAHRADLSAVTLSAATATTYTLCNYCMASSALFHDHRTRNNTSLPHTSPSSLDRRCSSTPPPTAALFPSLQGAMATDNQSTIQPRLYPPCQELYRIPQAHTMTPTSTKIQQAQKRAMSDPKQYVAPD